VLLPVTVVPAFTLALGGVGGEVASVASVMGFADVERIGLRV
jgi:hypothetical protein